MYNAEDLVKTGSIGKELAKFQHESVSAVKRTQAEIIQMCDSTYEQEIKIMENSEASYAMKVNPFFSGPSKEDEATRVIDYLSPWIEKDGRLAKEEAIRVKSACLQGMKESLMDRATIIQSKLNREKQHLVQGESKLEPENTASDMKFRIELLEKRLKEHEERSILKYNDLEKKLNEDIRLISLHETASRIGSFH